MIKELGISELERAAGVIRRSFATVALEFDLTEQNCPMHAAFSTTAERLEQRLGSSWRLYGLCKEGYIIGCAAFSKTEDTGNIYEIHNLAVLPEHRHRGYGKRLLDFCAEEIRGFGGRRIVIGIIEENTVLKEWYAEYGFAHTGTKKFDFFPFTCGYMEYDL